MLHGITVDKKILPQGIMWKDIGPKFCTAIRKSHLTINSFSNGNLRSVSVERKDRSLSPEYYVNNFLM